MTNPYVQQQKTRSAILVFIKGSAAPVILYVEDHLAVYNELKKCMETGVNKLFEQECQGPIKIASFMTGQISALAIQEQTFQ